MNKSNSIKCNSIEAIDRKDSSEQTKFRLDEVNKIENYFSEEINQRKSCSKKKLSKYVAVFDYIDQALIVLSAKSGGISILSFTSIVGASVGIANASFTLFFFSNNRNSQKLLNMTRKKKEKHDKILMTVCYCHVTYAFESESTLYSCLNVKEILARSRRET